MANPLTTILSMHIGVDSTDPEALSRIFRRTALFDNEDIHFRTVYAPAEVYDLYWDTYDLAMRLAESIDAVMANDEHQQIIDEARSLGYDLPDMEIFKEDVALYKQALADIQPYTAELSGRGFVKVPMTIARDLDDLMQKNCHMIARIFDECYNTEYLKHFAFYRKSGFRYMGPNALQPSVDLLLNMVRTVKEIDKQAKAGRQRPNWAALIEGDREQFLKPEI